MSEPEELFLYRFAALMKIWDVEGLAESMSYRQFVKWGEYYNTEPFGEERADLRMGILASTLVNIQMPKNSRRTKPADFMPVFTERKKRRRQTWQEMQALVKLITETNEAHKKHNGVQ